MQPAGCMSTGSGPGSRAWRAAAPWLILRRARPHAPPRPAPMTRPERRVGPGMRARARYVALAVATIAVGLTVPRWAALPLGARARDASGDALWAMMIAWWVGAAVPGAPLRGRAAA